MTKKNLQSLIEINKDIYKCLSISDATLVYGNPYFFIAIVWKNRLKTTIHTGKGSCNSLKANEVKAKYLKWVNQTLN